MSDADFTGAFGVSRHTSLSLDQLDDYYHGSQRLSFLHPEVRDAVNGRLRPLVINWPRLIVDSIEDRLDVEGFRLGDDKAANVDLWRIWQANEMDEFSQLAHLDALIYGRSFVLVWPDDDPATPRITVESARQMSVTYDPGTRRIAQAVKQWREGANDYRTTYDRQWITRTVAVAGANTPQWQLRDEPIRNVFGVVPVVPFVNRPTLMRPQGESEMTDVIPPTDAINKLSTDMMVTAEYTAMPRRWATGMDLGGSDAEADRTAAKVKDRWESAPGQKVWLGGPGAQFGQFPEAALANYVQGIDSLTARVAALAGLPPHYFGQAGENPASADALRSSESSLVKKVIRKQRVFGGAWERVMRMVSLVQSGEVNLALQSLETIWAKADTPTIAQSMDAAVKGVQAGIFDAEHAQEELGLTPVQMQRIAERRIEAATAPERARVALARELQADGLSENAALAAAGLLQAAALNSAEQSA